MEKNFVKSPSGIIVKITNLSKEILVNIKNQPNFEAINGSVFNNLILDASMKIEKEHIKRLIMEMQIIDFNVMGFFEFYIIPNLYYNDSDIFKHIQSIYSDLIKFDKIEEQIDKATNIFVVLKLISSDYISQEFLDSDTFLKKYQPFIWGDCYMAYGIEKAVEVIIGAYKSADEANKDIILSYLGVRESMLMDKIANTSDVDIYNGVIAQWYEFRDAIKKYGKGIKPIEDELELNE